MDSNVFSICVKAVVVAGCIFGGITYLLRVRNQLLKKRLLDMINIAIPICLYYIQEVEKYSVLPKHPCARTNEEDV